LIVVPENIKYALLRRYHNHKLSCHLGITKTLNRIKNNYTWKKINSDVAEFVKSCLKCQLAKAINHLPYGLRDSTAINEPGLCWSIDLLGPYVRSRNQYRFVLSIVDTFTKFVTMFPLRNATATACANALVHQCITFGIPHYIVSDNGPAFASRLWEKVCENLSITVRRVTPYRPCGNPIERYHRTIKACLITLIKKHRDWDIFLSGIMFALRTSINETTGFRPDFLTFGRHINLPFNPVEPPEQFDSPLDENYAKQLIDNIKNGIEIAKDNINVARQKQAKYYNNGRIDHPFAVGDFVLKKSHVLSNAAKGIIGSLASKYTGPYILTKEMGKNVFELETTDGQLIGNYNVDQLKLFHLRPDWAHKSDDSQDAKELSSSDENNVNSLSSDSEIDENLPGIVVPDEENETFEIDHTEIIPYTSQEKHPKGLRNRKNILTPLRYRN
jgi:hypothetical protein